MNPPPSNPPRGNWVFFLPLGEEKVPQSHLGRNNTPIPPKSQQTTQFAKIPPIRQNPPSGSLGFSAIFPKIRNFPQNPKFPPERVPPRKTPQGKLGDLFCLLGQKNSPNSPWGTKTTQLPPNIGGGGTGLASPSRSQPALFDFSLFLWPHVFTVEIIVHSGQSVRSDD